jgi:hypothetical protein
MICPFAFGSDFWVVDVNVILPFELRRMSFGIGFFAFRAEE